MQFYPLLVSLHIIFAGIWLVDLLTGPIFKSAIAKAKKSKSEAGLISLYLKQVNLLGMIGALGILITGIVMIIMNPGYGFFQFSANHWLVSKQIVMVVILILLGWKLIPSAKKVRQEIEKDLSSPVEDKTGLHSNLNKLYKIDFQINILVLINFLMAITRVFYS